MACVFAFLCTFSTNYPAVNKYNKEPISDERVFPANAHLSSKIVINNNLSQFSCIFMSEIVTPNKNSKKTRTTAERDKC